MSLRLDRTLPLRTEDLAPSLRSSSIGLGFASGGGGGGGGGSGAFGVGFGGAGGSNSGSNFIVVGGGGGSMGSTTISTPSRDRLRTDFGSPQQPYTYAQLAELQQACYRLCYQEDLSRDGAQIEFKKANELVRQLAMELSKRETLASSAQNENERLRDQLTGLDRELTKLRESEAERLQLVNENSKLRRELSSSKNDLRDALEEANTERERVYRQYREETRSSHEAAAAAQDKVSELEAKNIEKRRECTDLEENNGRLQQEIKLHEITIARLEAQQKQSADTLRSSEARIRELEQHLADQQGKVRDLQERLQVAEDRHRFSSLLETELNHTKTRELTAAGKLTRLEKECDDLRERVIRAEEASTVANLKLSVFTRAREVASPPPPTSTNSSTSAAAAASSSGMGGMGGMGGIGSAPSSALSSASTTPFPTAGEGSPMRFGSGGVSSSLRFSPSSSSTMMANLLGKPLPGSPQLQLEALWNEGKRALGSVPKEWMRGQRVFSRICEISKHDFQAHLLAAACFVYCTCPVPSTAELYIRTALSMNPNSMSANAILTRCLVLQNRFAEAHDVGQRILACRDDQDEQLRIVADGLTAFKEASRALSSAPPQVSSLTYGRNLLSSFSL